MSSTLEVNDQVRPTTSPAREKMHVVADRVADRIEHADSNLGKAKEELKVAYDKATQKLHDAYEKVAHTSLSDVGESVHQYVKSHPGRSMAMAAVAGLAVGYLLGRRR